MNSKEYWNKRVIEMADDKDKMLWSSRFRDELFDWCKDLLQPYKNCSILDVGCGWGAKSGLFNGEYLGIDFSENMIDLAKKECPNKKFEVADAYKYFPIKKYDVVLAYHLTGLPEKENEFIERYRPYANRAIVIVYGDKLVNINPNI